MKNVDYIQHKRSSAISSGSPVYPLPSAIETGELAINYAASAETLFIKNSEDVVVPFSSDEYYTEKMLGSGFSEHTVTEVIESDERITAAALNELNTIKQNTLISGENIKTIGGVSVLGPGDIEISPSIDIDDELSSSSTNPVENRVITSAISEIIDTIGDGFSESSITDVFYENEFVVSNALTDLDDRLITVSGDLATHVSNSSVHVTAQEKSGWNAKADLADVEAVSGAVTAHTSDTTVHVTAQEKSDWNAKADQTYVDNIFGSAFTAVGADSITKVIEDDELIIARSFNFLSGVVEDIESEISTKASMSEVETWVDEQGYATTEDITSAVSGKANSSDLAIVSGAVDALDGKIDIVSGAIPSVDAYFDGVQYDSNTKRINFYHGGSTTGSVLEYIDATDFIKDGMVSDAFVSGTNLVITFNTDAGKEDIEIPLSDIFDPSNFYTKSETSSSTEIAEALEDKLAIARFNEVVGSAFTGSSVDSITKVIEDDELAISTALNVLSGMITDLSYEVDDKADVFDLDVLSGKAITTVAGSGATVTVTTNPDGTKHLDLVVEGGDEGLSSLTFNNVSAVIENKSASLTVEADDITLGSGYTGEDVTANTGSGVVHLTPVSSDTISDAIEKLTTVIVDDEVAISTALNTLSGMITDLSYEVDDKADGFDLEVLSGKAITTVAGSGATVTVTTNPDGTRHLDLVVEGGDEGLSSLTFNNVSAVIENKSASLAVDAGDITLGSGYTGEDITANTGSGVVHLAPVSGDTISDAIDKLTTAIVDNEEVFAAAINVVSGAIDTHASDTSLHVSSAEKSALNGYDSAKGTLEARISYLENIITNLTTINVTGY